jgi:hypothetical protein
MRRDLRRAGRRDASPLDQPQKPPLLQPSDAEVPRGEISKSEPGFLVHLVPLVRLASFPDTKKRSGLT